MRKLKIFFITLICLLASNVAFTLGVGNIEVKSALSEPLNAEIQLFSVRPGEGDNIRVTLATLKEFTAAGIDRPLNLSYLKFKVIEKGDGNAYIQVYSERPIREPFLDFLVDIDWPSGHLLREYTLLLDPPIFAQRKAAPVQTPVVAAPTRIVREQKTPPAPVTFDSSPVPSAPVKRTRSEDDLFPRIEIDSAAAPAIDHTPAVAATPAYTGDTYKVQKSQTLWSIADAIRPDSSIGVSQMMLALQKANPDAFSNNNINGLKSGYVLRIPDLADIQAIDRQDAIKLAREQNARWQNAQNNLTSSVTPSGTTKTTSAAASKQAVSQQAAESTVKLVTPDTKTGSSQGVGTEDSVSPEKLALANEQIASKAKENDKLQDRVKSLEDQIGSMERLLELKDDSISELQSKLTDVKPTPAPEVEEMPEPVVEKSEPVVEEKKPEPVKPAVSDESKINPYALKEVPKAKPTTPAPVAKPVPAETSLFDDPVILAAIIAVILAVLVVIWLIMQRRRNNMQFPESILSGKPAASTTTTSTANAETSLLSDFAPSAMDGALEADSTEVDPSAEADVYIAYNKHQQAEELLLDAIKQEPDRLDLRLKLMEVYHATGNADSFLTHAELLNAAVDDQNTALWDKAVVMGRELCPGNELFGAADSATEDDFSDLEGIGDLDDDLDLSLDMDEVTSAADTDSEELSIDTDSDNDLSLDMELESFESSDEQEDELSLDIDDLSLEMDDTVTDTTADTETAAEQEPSIDFSELEIEDLDESDSVETTDLEIDTVSESEPEPELELTTESESVSELELSEELESSDIDDAMLGMDEVATKLDLAKAYIDMGDPDGARAILDEVLTEGSDAQQTEAKGLIDQL